MRLRAALVAMAIVGCGGASSGAGDLAPGELADLCAAYCDHGVDCAWITDAAGCPAACAGEVGLFRADAVRAQMACLTELACTTDNPGEACYVEVAADLSPLAVHERYAAACTAAEDSCGNLPGDVCSVTGVIFLSGGYMEAEVMPCLDLACDALRTCLEEKVLDAF